MKKTVAVIAILLVVSVGLGLCAGSVWLAPETWFRGDAAVLLQLRLLRMAAAFLVGGALAAAGAAYQAVLRNPLAEPYVMGVSAGAGLGAAAAVAAGAAVALPGAAFLGALLALGAVLLVAVRGGTLEPLRLLLSGVIVGTLASGILLFMVSCFSAAENQSLLWWMLGSLQAPEPRLLLAAAFIVPAGVAVLWSQGAAADIVSLGSELAHGFGVNVRRTFLLLLLTATLLAATAVALAGIIGFVGLLVPHCLRLLCGAANRRLFALSLFGGGIFLINCDTLARSVWETAEIPVGVVTALAGAPVFIYLLRHKAGR